MESGATYTVGQFADLAGVTAKTLRFYDAIGLLTPASVDPRTRYRRYLPEQLPRLAAILALRENGIPLKELKTLVRRKGDASLRRALLERARDQIAATLERAQRSLSWLEAELERLPGTPEPISIVLRHTPSLAVASLRSEVESYGQIEELERTLQAAVPPVARGLRTGVVWHRCAEAGLPIGEPFVEVQTSFSAKAGVRASRLPAVTVACAYTDGGDESTQAAYLALRRWIGEHRYRATGVARELYHPRLLEVQLCVEAV